MMMKKTLAILVATAASLAGASDVLADAWVARHGLDAAQYQAEFDQQAKAGFRLVDVSGYESNGSAHYAALWEHKSGPAWVANHGLNAQQYQAAFDSNAKAGYRLVLVNGYTVEGEDRYAAIWVKTGGPAWTARHGLSSQQYQAEFDKQAKAGFRLVHVSGYGSGGQDRYAAIWEKSAGPAWVARHGLTSAQYQAEFDKQAKAGFVLVKISGYSSGREAHYAAIWQKGGTTPWVAKHGLDSTAYQNAFDDLAHAGYRLTEVSGYGVGGSARYAAIWEHEPWQDVVCDGAKCVSISEVSNNIRERLNGNVVGYASYVGAATGLVNEYGKARTSAETAAAADFTMSTKLPVASVSKQMTALAATKVLASHNVSVESGIGKYLPPEWKLGKGIADITFKQLMSHTSGIHNYGNTSQDYDDLKAFFAKDIDPKNKAPDYSNYNFSIFRIMLPFIDGQPWGNEAGRAKRLADAYVKIAEKNVFEPVGLKDVACKPTGSLPYGFSYKFPGTSKGWDWGDTTAGCGAAGWYLSVYDAATVLISLNNVALSGHDGPILTKDQQKFMEDHKQGWDMTVDGSYRYVEKNGGWGWNGTSLSTSIALIGPGVVGVLFVNSDNVGSAAPGADTVLREAYMKALKPKAAFAASMKK
jgi:CubicO group peptidase (beta-lactamase class C family)